VPFVHNVEKYGTVGQATDDNIMRRMRFACRTTKATNTHSEYVVLIACALQQWSQKRTSLPVLFNITSRLSSNLTKSNFYYLFPHAGLYSPQ